MNVFILLYVWFLQFLKLSKTNFLFLSYDLYIEPWFSPILFRCKSSLYNRLESISDSNQTVLVSLISEIDDQSMREISSIFMDFINFNVLYRLSSTVIDFRCFPVRLILIAGMQQLLLSIGQCLANTNRYQLTNTHQFISIA